MKRAQIFGIFAVVTMACAAPAFAQQTPPDSDVIVSTTQTNLPPPVDQVDRIPGAGQQGGPRMMGPRGDGVRVVKPGALLFASYDANQDGKITQAEVDAGAEGSFKAADKNADGMLAGFEQNEWAASVGSINDVLTNSLTFDVDLDRNVSKKEFAEGIRRLATAAADPATGVITFASLIQSLSQQADRGGPAPAGAVIMRGPGGRGPGGPPGAPNANDGLLR